MNKIITFSGVHGVGKSTIISLVNSTLKITQGAERPPNPFLTPYEAMLFFVSSFSQRDESSLNDNMPILLDRWSTTDIKIYAKVLRQLNRITSSQEEIIYQAISYSSSKKIVPDIAFLLDDNPSNILKRIEKFRIPSKHHIYERDLEFISALQKEFITVFNNDLNCKDKFIIDFRNKDLNQISKEVTDLIQKYNMIGKS